VAEREQTTAISIQSLLARIPPVDQLLNHPGLQPLLQRYDRGFIRDFLVAEVDNFRRRLRENPREISRQEIGQQVIEATVRAVEDFLRPSIRRVINATGILLHTGLGRAPLAEEAKRQLQEVVENYCSLEINLETGQRGERLSHVEALLCRLTGAEAAAVVNNNAAAVLLVLNTLAKGKEVIVSRGQLVEIGGSFRMPEVMKQSGAIMVEVGTTNKTHLRDYEQAIGPNTAVLFAAHPSNYRILGFTKEVSLQELVELGRRYHLPVVYDLGGGVLVELEKFGLPHEPVVSQVMETGVDVATFSGDKVLGGPQSGIIVGKKAHLQRIRANPLMRALRCGKLTYAALEPTLKLYVESSRLTEAVPSLRLMTEPIAGLEERAHQLMEGIQGILPPHVQCAIEQTTSQVGSGALPLEEIPSVAFVLWSSRIPAEKLAARFRAWDPPIVGYVREERLYLDMRTVREDEVPILIEACSKILGEP